MRFDDTRAPLRTEAARAAQTQGCPPHIAILGAGPAGTAAALSLARDRRARVSVLEARERVGGNAGSFQIDGIWCDHGSHRLHPVAEARVLDDVKALLGDDLLLRPRHGRILLQGRWIHFPLKPLDLLLRLPKRFTLSLAWDTVRKLLPQGADDEETFASVLRRGLGPTMSEAFYYPYVRKLWGLEPGELAVTLAERRVSGSSVGKILTKILRQLPGLKSETTGRFYYPRQGFGQICERYYEAAAEHGADFLFSARVTGIERDGGRVRGVRYEQNGEEAFLATDAVWSTLPISLLVKLMTPSPPSAVLSAASSIRFRGMILIYLVLEQDQFTEYDAHYFPEQSIPISRMSEPKNYSASTTPKGRTVLCAELPCDPGQPEWKLSDEELGRRFCDWLATVGLPVTAPVNRTLTRRLSHAYPVYDRDYEAHFRTMDEWLAGLEGLLTFGRQGLFAHDNTHHAITMAYAACDCLQADGGFDWHRWGHYRREFETHVVED